MMVTFKKSNRRVLNTLKNVVSKAEVKPISIDAMIIKSSARLTYFKRMRYKGCPKLAAGGRFIGKAVFHPDTVLVHMNRDHFIRDMYQIFTDETITLSKISVASLAGGLIRYVAIFDKHNRSVDFSETNVDWFFAIIDEKRRKGELSVSSVDKFKKLIIFILVYQGEENRVKHLRKISRKTANFTPTEPLSLNESRNVSEILHNAYRQYVMYFLNNKELEVCPLFNEKIIRLMKDSNGDALHSDYAISRFRSRAKMRISSGRNSSINRMVSIAFFITARWTGANFTPLVSLTRGDIRFKKREGNNYVLDSIKGRAGFEDQAINIGFTKRTKEFIESWLQVSGQIAPNDDDWLFSTIGDDGQLRRLSGDPQGPINKALKPYGLSINTRILRSTRSSLIMRATGNVITTADANRNSIATTINRYINGSKETSEIQLAGALIAQGKMAMGEEKKQAIAIVISKFKDPMSDFEYQQMAGKVANVTKSGARCTEPFGERAKKSMRKYRDIKSTDKTYRNEPDTCIDFLGCFECPSHVLIAEIDDIWLMLSFKDTLISSLSRTSYNSIPSENADTLLILTNAALQKLKEASSKNYKAAVDKNIKAPHPLYDDDFAIEDLIGVYNE